MVGDRVMVGGRYELGDLLGRGGMAEVRRAVDTRLGRPVAVKRLRADLAADATFQARFRREAQAAAGLNHPAIVSVYDTGEEPDPVTEISIPYIVMELIDGPTLSDVLRTERKLPAQRALELTRAVLEALDHSHRAGIVHRDIKPANVMLAATGGVKVMDFGIARAIADTSGSLTRTAAVIGTASYLSPEQARGEKVDARSDIYSVGCLLYELLLGRPPFVGEVPVSIAYQHVREPPVPPSTLDPSIGPEVDAIVLKALAKDPADRYQSAAEMNADISRVLGDQPATGVPPSAGPASTTDRAADATPTMPLGQVPAASTVPLGSVPPPLGPVPAPTQGFAPTVVQPPTPTVEPSSPKRRVGLTALIAALVVAILAAAAFGIYRVLTGPSSGQTVVPNVLTLSEQQARDQLTSRQLKVELKTAHGADKTKGTIVAQSPKAGARVDKNSTVTLTLNKGPNTGVVPTDLVGKNLEAAQQELDRAGFTNVDSKGASTEDPTATSGQVLSVSPPPGSTVSLDDKITLMYATGKSEVPDFSGADRARATQLAAAAGFTQPTFVEQASGATPGTVIAQSPKAGAKVDRGTQITLTLAKAGAPPSSAPPSSAPHSATPTATPS